MSRQVYSIEKGLHIQGVDSLVGVKILFGSGAPGGDADIQDGAEQGSMYLRTDGTMYQKTASGTGTDKWKYIDVTNVETALGIADNATDMGTFTGSILTDNEDVKALLQELEVDLEALQTASGIAAEAVNFGTFTGSILTDNSTAKVLFQELEVDTEAIQTSLGIAAEAVNFGTFTGTILTDNSTAKVLFQELETDMDAIQTSLGIAAEAVDFGTFTGTIIPDNSDAKEALQALETEIENVQTNISVDNVTTLDDIDSVLVDDVVSCEWFVMVQDNTTNSNRQSFLVTATHNGIVGGADADAVDDNVFAKLKLGTGTDVVISVDINGTGAAQVMRLMVSSVAGVDVRAIRRKIVF